MMVDSRRATSGALPGERVGVTGSKENTIV